MIDPTGEARQGAGSRAGREDTKCEGGCVGVSVSRDVGVSRGSTEVDTTGTVGTVGTRGSGRVFDAFRTCPASGCATGLTSE